VSAEAVKLPMLLATTKSLTDYQCAVLEFIFRQPTPVNIQYAMKQVNKSFQGKTNKDKEFNREYTRLYRLLKRLEKIGALELFKMDGLIWVKPKDPTLLDLMKGRLQNCDFAKPRKKSPFIPKRCNEHRKEAIKIALSRQMLDEKRLKQIEKEFEAYVSSSKYRKIILKRHFDAPTFYPEFLVLDYKTRFTSKEYLKKQIKNVNEIFKIASQKYQNAVLLTLTTDPKRFKSSYHGWKSFGKNFAKFMRWLTKRLGERPLYSSFYEFTKSGLLHTHVLIFGEAYLIPKQEIVDEWKRLGQGEIVDIVALQNSSGRWHSLGEVSEAKKKVSNMKGYLMKYLKKALINREGLGLYFASNKRFLSWSYRLYHPEVRIKESLGVFYFLCSAFEWEIPLVVLEAPAREVKWCGEYHYSFNFL